MAIQPLARALILVAACGPPPAPSPTPIPVPTQPIADDRPLPERCDDDAVDNLKSGLISPGGSPRLSVAFALAPGSATFELTRGPNSGSNEVGVEIKGETVAIETGDSSVVLAIASGVVTLTDGDQRTKRNWATEIARDFYGVAHQSPTQLLPTTPIGRGARWRNVTRDRYGLLASELEALELSPTEVKLRIARLECRKMMPIVASPSAGPPECDEPNPSEADPIRCFEGTEWSSRIDRGELSVSLERPVPVGTVSSESEWVYVDFGNRQPGSSKASVTLRSKGTQ